MEHSQEFIHSFCAVKIGKRLLLLFLILSNVALKAQSLGGEVEIKHQIDLLLQKKDVMEANRLLNQNTSLDFEYVLKTLSRNRQIATESRNQEALAYTLLSLGNFWFLHSNHIKAYEYYFECEQISRQYQLHRITGLALMNRSSLLHDPAVIKEMLIRALDCFRQTQDSINMAKAHLNLGNAFSSYVLGLALLQYMSHSESTLPREYSDEEKIFYRDSAFYHFRQADAINRKLNHPELTASILLRYAQWESYDGRFRQALDLFNEAKLSFIKASHAKGIAFCTLETARLQVKMGLVDEARESLNRVVEMAESHNFPEYIPKAYSIWVQLSELQGNFKEALAYQQKFTLALIGLNESMSRDKIQALHLENTLREQAMTMENMARKKKFNILLLVLAVVLILFVSVSVILFYHVKRKKMVVITQSLQEADAQNRLMIELMESQLANQNLQRELLAEKLRSRSENLMMVANQMQKLENFYGQLSQEVKALASEPSVEKSKHKIKELKVPLTQMSIESKNLRELSVFSEQANQDFFFYVEKNIGKLTRDEKKLLSFLIQEMNSKDIAGQLNISPDSVHKKRYRLRKKLGMDPAHSFTDFYQQILSTRQNQ